MRTMNVRTLEQPIRFKNWDCKVNLLHYANGERCIQLVDSEDGYPVSTATVVLHSSPPKDSVWIKGWSENEGMAGYLQDAAIICGRESATTTTGFVEVQAYPLTDDILALFEEMEQEI